jgi:hypothetical protein
VIEKFGCDAVSCAIAKFPRQQTGGLRAMRGRKSCATVGLKIFTCKELWNTGSCNFDSRPELVTSLTRARDERIGVANATRSSFDCAIRFRSTLIVLPTMTAALVLSRRVWFRAQMPPNN